MTPAVHCLFTEQGKMGNLEKKFSIIDGSFFFLSEPQFFISVNDVLK